MIEHSATRYSNWVTGRRLYEIWVCSLFLFAAGVARATTFNYIAPIMQTYTVATTGVYDIIGYGAQGGQSYYGPLGGLGAEIGGEFDLNAGTVLDIYIGQMGQGGPMSGGGGGGTFVVNAAGNLALLVAGGGGGASTNVYGGQGVTTHSGSRGGLGGTGSGISGGGGGGGGFTGNGIDGCCYEPGDGSGGRGFSTLTGGAGDIIGDNNFPDGNGGYGGGGGGGVGGGGGGGGYSGGYGGANWSGTGGGSYDAGLLQVLMAGERQGNGLVTITYVGPIGSQNSTPEPSTPVLLGLGLSAILVVRRQLGGIRS